MSHFSSLLHHFAGLLALMLLPLTAPAQTAPAWTSARTVGPGTQVLANGAVDAAGNLYEIGRFSDATVVDGVRLVSRGSDDGYLAKYTAAGTLAWVRHLGSPGYDQVLAVAVDAAGNAYVVGDFVGRLDFGGVVLTTPSPSAREGFVVQYSPQGIARWAQPVASTSALSSPATSVGVDGAGRVVVTGFYQAGFTLGPASLPTLPTLGVYLARFSAAGEVQWLRPACRYESSQGIYRFPQLATGPSGDTYLVTPFHTPIIAGGTTYGSRGFFDCLAIRFSDQGLPLWAQPYGGPGDDWLSQAAVDAAGNLYVSGHFARPMTVDKLTLTSRGGADTYVAKYSGAGALLWAQAGGGPDEDLAQGLAVDAAGNAYLTGSFTDQASYGSWGLSNSGVVTTSVVAYSPQGAVRWAQQGQGSGYSSGLYLGLDAGGSLRLLGRTQGRSRLGTFVLDAPGDGETFVASLGNVLLPTQAAAPLPDLSSYPNPATDQVRLAGVPAGRRVQVVDAQGRVVREATVAANAQVTVRGLAPGLYLLRATDAQGRPVAGKVLVE